MQGCRRHNSEAPTLKHFPLLTNYVRLFLILIGNSLESSFYAALLANCHNRPLTAISMVVGKIFQATIRRQARAFPRALLRASR